MKRAIVCFLVISFGLLLKSCNTTEPPPPPPPPNGTTVFNTINLTVEWTDLHRIKLKWNVSAKDTLHSYRYELRRKDETGGETAKNFFISGADTSYIDGETDSLASGKQFKYKIRAYDSEEKLIDTSKTILTETLAPTSHNITWQIDTLGQPGDFLNDVWGLDENNVYAVGAVNMPQGVTSVIKWDGVKWNYHSWPEGGASGIWGFSENDIWIVGKYSNRGFIGYFNGSTWTEYRDNYFLSRGDTVYPLRAVWGSAPNDVWAVGDNGTIIHWDGAEWRKVEGIDSRYKLWDIWGFNENVVYAAGNQWNNKVILYEYNGSNWQIKFSSMTVNPRRSSVWGAYKETFYLIDYEQYRFDNGSPTRIFFENRQSKINKIRGEGNNNILTVGDFSEVYHFNGLSWKRIDELYTYPTISALLSCFIVNGKIFSVGYMNEKVIIIRGIIN